MTIKSERNGTVNFTCSDVQILGCCHRKANNHAGGDNKEFSSHGSMCSK